MTARFGAFGKMPSLGDFFRVELPQGFVDPWDRWLQEGLVSARAALGPRWQDNYFSAPIWRFSLSPGLAGAAAVIGVMMMSVDRVGRQFPLTLATTLPDGSDPILTHIGADRTFVALEAVALDALEDTMTRDRLAANLDPIDCPAAPIVAAGLRREPGGVVVTGPGDLIPRIAAEALRSTIRHPSAWSAEVDGETRMMVCEGLPAGGQLVGLFDLGARVWTGREGHDDTLADAPPPVMPMPAPLDLPPAAMVAAPRKPEAPVAEHVPLEDPLADIIGHDEPLFTEVDPDDDPFAAILSGGDPTEEAPADAAAPARHVPDAPQEA
jgi:type VI secretion system protein ImpM